MEENVISQSTRHKAILLSDALCATAGNDEAGLPHVLLVVDQFTRTLGGGERVLLKLAALLPAYGYRVSILTFFVHPESPALMDWPCPVYLLPMKQTFSLASLRGALTLRRFIRQQRVAIVQTFFESSDIWAGFVVKILTSSRLIWSRRDMGILRSRKHAIAYRLMSRLPDAVFAVSEQVRGHAIEIDRIDPARVLTIYNGLTLSDWKQGQGVRECPHKTVVCTAGNVRRVKGHDIFVKAAALIAPKYPEVTFKVAGEVLELDYFEELQRLVTDLGLASRFQFSGGIRQLAQYFAEASIFVLPSRSEGFSNAIVEAMAASLPVIATAVGGNGEAVQHGVSGLLIPPEDIQALAVAMEQLIVEPLRSSQMGLAGRDRVARNYTTEAMMERTTQVYRKLLGDS